MRSCLTVLMLLWLALPASGEPVFSDHLEVELISRQDALVPGEDNWLGLRLNHDPEWHTYWLNPGDSGLETMLYWDLPDGIEAGDIAWPLPHRLPVEHLVNYGYSDEMVLPIPISVNSSWQPGAVAEIKLRADWLVCKIDCIPGSAELSLLLPIATNSQALDRWDGLFGSALSQQPITDHEIQTGHSLASGELVLQLEPAPSAWHQGAHFELYPERPGVVENAPPVTHQFANGQLTLRKPASALVQSVSESLSWLLVVELDGQRQGWRLESTEMLILPPVSNDNPGLWLALLMAFLGGLILNLMPCVLPILSLKALSLTQHAQAAIRTEGLAYLVGVLLMFVLVAALLLGLRAAGGEVGWGFQLQSPVFVAAMALLLFAVGLNLSGVYKISSAWSGSGQSLTEKGGAWGAFFTGLLAVVVATPCTAPFMAAALGAAVTMPAPQALMVFLALGLGFALPLFLVHEIPSLANRLPKPGAWMVRFQQLLAFPIYLTVVWLCWVLINQSGANAGFMLGTGLVLMALGFSLWAWGDGRLLRGIAVTTLIGSIAVGVSVRPSTGSERLPVQPYSQVALNELLQQQKPVFVYMTADWCITCKVNESIALQSDRFLEVVEELQITVLEGDWTSRDKEITRYLADFGRNGVPLYVYYSGQPGEPPQVLPQVLTPGLLVDEVKNL